MNKETFRLTQTANRILSFLLDNNVLACTGMTVREVIEGGGFDPNEFDLADGYLLSRGYVEGTGGGEEGFRWITSEGVDFLEYHVSANERSQNRLEMKVNAIPTYYSNFSQDISRFHEDGAFEKSVFVMMKFPDQSMDTKKQNLLHDIYDVIRDELDAYGLMARRADDQVYVSSRQLWDNVCVYMLGCQYGIAVLEDKVAQELNPNIALEYGFMRGLGREVALLREQSFGHTRVDLIGTIAESFQCNGLVLDKGSLRKAVGNWLVGKLPRRRRA